MVSISQGTRTNVSIIPLWPWGYVAVSAVAIAAVLIAPLAAYVGLIALFGLPHVLCELRYCDERFCARAPRAALMIAGGLLVSLAAVRIAQALGGIAAMPAVFTELGLGAALAFTAVLFMPRRRIVGALAGLALAGGTAFAPIMTFLVVAWLHNLTPLGFLSEILPPRERARAILPLLIPFLLVPTVIATGWPQAAIRAWLGYTNETAPSLFAAGRLPLSAFLPGGLSFHGALPLFSAAVAAQAMHYLSVIAVMPQLLNRYGTPPPNPLPQGEGGPRRSLVPWPSWPLFYAGVGAAALLVFAFNAIDYKTARAFYSAFAALHSWVELPIFLIALGLGFTASGSGSRR